MKKVSRLSPLTEFTLRKLEMPFSDNYRDLVRAFCVSTGLLQPGDSRDSMVDIFLVLLKYSKKKKLLYTGEIKQIVSEYRTHKGLDSSGLSSSNLLRDLKVLKDKGFTETVNGAYRLREWLSLTEIFEKHIENYLIRSTIERIKEYSERIDSLT